MARERVQLKTRDQVLMMRQAGLVVADALAAVRAAAAPGATTADLDAAAAEVIAAAGATPSFLGYHGFPASTCVSVNEEVVHGIPGARVLAAGDVVSVDCGAVVDGWHGDAAFTAVLGARDGSATTAGGDDAQVDAGDAFLVATTEAAMWDGIAALAPGRRLRDVGAAVQDRVEGRPGPDGTCLEVVEGYTGHGIGTEMHQAPDVLNHRVRAAVPWTSGEGRVRLRPGMCLAVEPMVVRGGAATSELDDGWTVVTASGERAAHSEHTVALLEHGLWVLTAPDGGAAELGARGVAVTPLG